MSPHDRDRFSNSSGDYRWLLARLDRFRRYLKSMALLEALSNTLLVFLVLAPALFLLDNWLHFAGPLRLLAFLGLLLGIATAAQTSLRLALQPWGYERLALRIEEKFPELENRLINAVQLGPQEEQSPARDLIHSLVEESVAEARRLQFAKAIDKRKIRWAGVGSVALAAAVSIYPLLFPDYFANAAERILLPASDIQPLTKTHLRIAPGSTSIGRGETLRIEAQPTGDLPRSAHVQVRGDGVKSEFSMAFDGQSFVYELSDVQEALQYRVMAGDFTSSWFAVKVLIKPRVERMALRIDYPSYTGLSASVVDPSDGSVTALAGSRATVTAFTSKPIKTAAFDTGDGAQQDVKPASATTPDKDTGKDSPVSKIEAQFVVEKDSQYKWLVWDGEGLGNTPAPQYAIHATADAPPRAVISSPRGEVEVPKGDKVPVLFSASDDYGLSHLLLTQERQSGSTALYDKQYKMPPQRLVSDGVEVDSAAFNVGEQVRLTLEATDNNPRPGTAKSDSVTLKITAPRANDRATSDSVLNFANDLMALLESQKETHAAYKMWCVTLDSKTVDATARATALNKIVVDQSQIRATTLQLLESPILKDSKWAEARGTLASLSAKEMRAVMDQLRAVDAQKPRAAQTAPLQAVDDSQSAIIKRLEDLLGVLRAAFPELKDALDEAKADTEKKQDASHSMAELYGKTIEYMDDQKAVLASLQKMENVDPKNFNTEQKMAVEEMAKREQQWTDYFKDAADWLRKSPMVDGTESGLRDELIEMNIEIEKLPQDLVDPAKTINVDAQTTANGLELASKLTSNLEKWLPEQPDAIKWVMENSPTDYQVPLAQLPDQLEDMMGDLIDSEQNMTDANEDQTSNWADSLDKGAGWEASDGPISNYSAKGVTGNTLPNNDDISGRSGEGRNGRSLGEMVEKVATGKGGRDTPTRMTADAMGKGTVQDLSTEQVKGATGGGKIAGTTGWGLVSGNAPAQPEMVQKMSQAESDLKMKALNLDKNLVQLQLPAGQLQSAIQGMDKIQQSLQSGHYDNLRDLHAVVVSDLKSQRDIVRSSFQLRNDPTSGQQRQVQHKIEQGAEEDFPQEYRNLLSAYYQSLSQEMK